MKEFDSITKRLAAINLSSKSKAEFEFFKIYFRGVFLPLITTNCCILGVAILVIQKDYDLLTGVVYAFSTALGFGLALTLFAGLREQMSLVNIPKGMQGTPIALITAGLLAMAFMGFSGVVKI